MRPSCPRQNSVRTVGRDPESLEVGKRGADGAPGEIKAALELLKLLDLTGATVTADANSCTAAISTAVREAGADYVLALKGNRSALHSHVETLFL